MTKKQKIALFIDAEYVSAKHIEQVLDVLDKYGVVSIRRAYGNWSTNCLQGGKEVLQEHAIVPVQHFALTAGKNAVSKHGFKKFSCLLKAIDVFDIKSVGGHPRMVRDTRIPKAGKAFSSPFSSLK